MVHSCFIVGCKSHSALHPNEHFFTIPAIISSSYRACKKENVELLMNLSKARQHAWIQAIRRGPLTESQLKNVRICSKHFITGKPATLTDNNNPDWAPCKNLGYSVGFGLKKTSDLERHARACKRSADSEDSGIPKKKSCSENHGDAFFQNDFSFCDEAKSNQSFMKDATTQTDILMDDLTDLFEELILNSDAKNTVEEKLQNFMLLEKAFLGNDKKTNFFTGLSHSNTLFLLHELVTPFIQSKCRSLTTFQSLVLTLMKLRLNLSFQYLSYRYGVSIYTVSRCFRRCLHVLFCLLQPIIHWPDRGILHATMPSCFRVAFGNSITVIIDCFEVFVESAANLASSAECWSSYKHHKTAKLLIGVTPQGSVCFISDAWGGRTSDKVITEKSGFLDHLIHGDVVMADRGFLIEDFVEEMGATLKIPAFTKGKNQLDPLELQDTREVANVRIHVERVIGAVRQKFQILSGIVPVSMLVSTSNGLNVFDEIVFVCCALLNLCPSVVKES